MTEFDVVYSQYFDDVYKYTLSLCRNQAIAEDITQETFIKALKNIEKFKGECNLRVWLCQIAKNTYFSLCKKNKYLTNEQIIESHGKNIEQILVDNESVSEIYRELNYLKEPYKEVFSLRVFGELSFSQIAELLGKTETWSRVTFHRAKLKIQEALK